VDRLVVRPGCEKRLVAGLEKAMLLGGDTVLAAIEGEPERLYSRRLACVQCDISVPEVSPRAFSFNSVYGACPACEGLGRRWDVDPAKVIPDDTLSLLEGAIHPWRRHGARLLKEALHAVARRHGFALDAPVRDLRRKALQVVLHGDGAGFAGVLPHLRRRLESALRVAGDEGTETRGGGEVFEELRPYLADAVCPECRGRAAASREPGRARHGQEPGRLRPAPGERGPGRLRRPRVPGPGATRGRPASAADPRPRAVPGERRRRLPEPGPAHHVPLRGRGAPHTAGRADRGAHAGRALRPGRAVGGPAPARQPRLLETLKGIRDLGNTVVVVEHDEETIRSADWIVDLGEGAGREGGRLMYQGPPASVDGSLTGRYLRGELKIPVPPRRRTPSRHLRILGARAHNLKDIDVTVPIGVLTAVTGVSGAGKSTLVEDILYRALAHRLHGAALEPGRHRGLEGAEHLDKVIAIDQTPIGRTPRSNPATYTGAFASIRELFSLVPEARARGYKAGRFSFNVKGGRCEACQGGGVRIVEMHLLPDVYVRCEACKGRRYNRETLEILYRGRTVADVLDMTVSEAQAALSAHPRLNRLLLTLMDVGLGYVRLGQSATTLSGGEAQRVKLARELGRRDTGRTLYILDEPTTGLHFDDVRTCCTSWGGWWTPGTP
jgi:excinuclease ABC subunit A